MVPDWEWTHALLRRKQRALVEGMEYCCTEEGWGAPTNNFNKTLRRYRLPIEHTACDGCGLPSGVLEDGLHILARLHPGRGGRAVAAEYEYLSTNFASLCAHQVRKLLKETTGWLKLGGRFCHPRWRLLTYWETFFGYVPPGKLKDLRDDVDDWLTRTKHNGERISEAAYIEDLILETREYIQEEWVRPASLPTLEEWVQAGVWMRGKAGTGQATELEIEGKLKRTRRYKGVDAALKTTADLIHELREPRQEVMKVMQKSEGGKVRPVVVGGNALYRKMDFLSELVESGFTGSHTSTLFAGVAGNESIDRAWLEEIKNPNVLKVPLDQSSFDNNQSKSSILAIFLAIQDNIIHDPATPAEYRQVWGAMWDTLTEYQPQVEMEGDRRGWENGVPSGWRWTALLDTILNIVSFRVAIKYCLRYYNDHIPVGRCTMQGDDVIFTTTHVRAVESLVAMYQTLGYKVHPHKTYISQDRGEFLRRSYECSGITGYTPRTLLSLRFRNPIIPMPIAPAERLYSRLALWSLARQRGADPSVCADMYLEDAEQSGISREIASAFALTPATYGGAGLEVEEGHMGARLEGLYGRNQPWVRPKITKPSLTLRPKLGRWKERLPDVDVDVEFTGTYREQFNRLLAITWGIRF